MFRAQRGRVEPRTRPLARAQQLRAWNGGRSARKASVRIPVVLTREEVRTVISGLERARPACWQLLVYRRGPAPAGSGRSSAKDVDFERNQITVPRGQGRQGRVTISCRRRRPRPGQALESGATCTPPISEVGAGWARAAWALAGRQVPS